MSRHPSFGKSAKVQRRSVLKRFERVEALKKLGRWKGKRVTGLPKVRTI